MPEVEKALGQGQAVAGGGSLGSRSPETTREAESGLASGLVIGLGPPGGPRAPEDRPDEATFFCPAVTVTRLSGLTCRHLILLLTRETASHSGDNVNSISDALISRTAFGRRTNPFSLLLPCSFGIGKANSLDFCVLVSANRFAKQDLFVVRTISLQSTNSVFKFNARKPSKSTMWERLGGLVR